MPILTEADLQLLRYTTLEDLADRNPQLRHMRVRMHFDPHGRGNASFEPLPDDAQPPDGPPDYEGKRFRAWAVWTGNENVYHVTRF